MDYEKAYKAVLQTATQWIKDGCTDKERICLECVFPELRESEDERIRKALIDGVRQIRCKNGITQEQMIAYLEKQREQEPILEVFGFKVGDAVRLKDGDGRKHIIKSFEEVEGIHGPNFYHVEFEDNSARDGIYPGEEYPNGYYTQMEKFEEEQKPVEKQDYSGLTDLERAIHRGFLCAGVENVPVTIIKETAQECLARMKPAEWSEKDDQLIGFIFDLLNSLVWRKEWAMDKKECLERLKSIRPRPSWKPSDEQMRALQKAVNKLARSDVSDSVRLSIMYDNLKKLM